MSNYNQTNNSNETQTNMPSVRYYNQTAPFWDFVANLEEQGSSHPMFANRGENSGPNPWAEGWAGFPFGPHPYRGRHGPPHQHPAAPQAAAEGETSQENEKEGEAGPSDPR